METCILLWLPTPIDDCRHTTFFGFVNDSAEGGVNFKQRWIPVIDE